MPSNFYFSCEFILFYSMIYRNLIFKYFKHLLLFDRKFHHFELVQIVNITQKSKPRHVTNPQINKKSIDKRKNEEDICQVMTKVIPQVAQIITCKYLY